MSSILEEMCISLFIPFRVFKNCELIVFNAYVCKHVILKLY